MPSRHDVRCETSRRDSISRTISKSTVRRARVALEPLRRDPQGTGAGHHDGVARMSRSLNAAPQGASATGSLVVTVPPAPWSTDLPRELGVSVMARSAHSNPVHVRADGLQRAPSTTAGASFSTLRR